MVEINLIMKPATNNIILMGSAHPIRTFSTTTASFSFVSNGSKTSPFAALFSSSGPMAKTNPFRFSTKWWDDETGLGNWGRRYYHPDEGRWISRDPIGEKDSGGLYIFVRNAGVINVDKRGLWTLDVTGHLASGSDCGGFTYNRTIVVVPGPNDQYALNETVWIIQRIDVKKKVYDCRNNKLISQVEYHFWEELGSNDYDAAPPSGSGWMVTDTWADGDNPDCTRGTSETVGHVYFFNSDIVGTPPRAPWKREDPGHPADGAYHLDISGIAQSTIIEGRSDAGPSAEMLLRIWNCCYK